MLVPPLWESPCCSCFVFVRFVTACSQLHRAIWEISSVTCGNFGLIPISAKPNKSTVFFFIRWHVCSHFSHRLDLMEFAFWKYTLKIRSLSLSSNLSQKYLLTSFFHYTSSILGCSLLSFRISGTVSCTFLGDSEFVWKNCLSIDCPLSETFLFTLILLSLTESPLETILNLRPS